MVNVPLFQTASEQVVTSDFSEPSILEWSCLKNLPVSTSSTFLTFFFASGWLRDSLTMLAYSVCAMSRILCILFQLSEVSSILLRTPLFFSFLLWPSPCPLSTKSGALVEETEQICLYTDLDNVLLWEYIAWTLTTHKISLAQVFIKPGHHIYLRYNYVTFHSHHKLLMILHQVMW